MTCAVGLKLNNKVSIGADHLATVKDSENTEYCNKILQQNSYTMAFAGHGGFLFLLKYLLDSKINDKKFDDLCLDIRGILTLFPNEISQMIITDGFNMATIDWRDGKWKFEKSSNNNKYFVIGSGDAAVHAFFKSPIDQYKNAKHVINAALNAAHLANPKTVGDKFTIIQY